MVADRAGHQGRIHFLARTITGWSTIRIGLTILEYTVRCSRKHRTDLSAIDGLSLFSGYEQPTKLVTAQQLNEC